MVISFAYKIPNFASVGRINKINVQIIIGLKGDYMEYIFLVTFYKYQYGEDKHSNKKDGETSSVLFIAIVIV